MMKECMKPHPLLHSLMGIGLGLVLVSLVPSLVSNGLTIGVVLIIVAFVAEQMMGKKPQQKA